MTIRIGMTSNERQAFTAGAAQAHEAARRAMFAAASRVLSYHAAAVDAKAANAFASHGRPEGTLKVSSQEPRG